MPKYPNLAIRGTKYYFRRKVPLHLRDYIKKTEWTQSFGTVELKEANRLCAIKCAETDREIQKAELLSAQEETSSELGKGLARKPLSKEAAKHLATIWGGDRIVKLRNAFYGDAELFSNTSKKKERVSERKQRLHRYTKATAKSVTSFIINQAKKLLKAYKFVAVSKIGSDHAAAYRVLLDEIRRAECKALNYEISLLSDHMDIDYASYGFDEVAVSNARKEVAPNPKGYTLGDLIEIHKRHQQEKGKSVSSNKKWTVIYSILTDLWGASLPLAEINRQLCREELKQFFMDCPVNAKKLYPDHTYKQIWEKAIQDDPVRMAAKTINDKLAYVSTLFKFACEEGLMDMNPAINLAVAKDDKSTSRVPFEWDEIRDILTAPPFDTEKGAHYYILLLALYQGMRSNEICQLLATDIRKEAGVWIVDISEDRQAGKHLKSKAAKRMLPLHSKVIEGGFLDFVRAGKQEKKVRLFPDVKADSEGSYSNNFRGWFKRHLDRAGVTTDKKSMHSFRHTFETELINKGVPMFPTVKLLMGHALGAGVSDGYYHGAGIKSLKEAIERVDYG